MVSQNQEVKGLLALQAFLRQEDDERIMALCLEVQEIEGHESYLYRCSTPLHITLATWEVTQQEVQLAQSQFASKLSDIEAITVPVTLGGAYALLPEPTEALLQWHAQVHAKADWLFEPWKGGALPGSWWPHIGACHIAKSKEHLANEPLRKLREIKEVTIERIGLVSYFDAMQILEEVTLKRTESCSCEGVI